MCPWLLTVSQPLPPFRIHVNLPSSPSLLFSSNLTVDYRIRLVGGASKLEGRVEVKSDSSWGTICDDNWDLTDSNVVCRMLGYERAESYFSCEKYEKVSKRKQIILDEVECDGTEANIGHCRVQHWHDCTHDEDVGMKCVDWKTGTSTTLSSSTKAAGKANSDYTWGPLHKTYY